MAANTQKVWNDIEAALKDSSSSEGVMTRMVILAEIAEPSGAKRLLVISSDAAGTRLKPWETEGFLTSALIECAVRDI